MKIWEHKIIYLEDEATKIQGSSYLGAEVSMTALYEDAMDGFGGEGWLYGHLSATSAVQSCAVAVMP